MTTEASTSILVIECDDAMRGLLYDWLRVVFPHHPSISAPNVDEAIANMDSRSPEVIIVDISALAGDGIESTRRIKAAAPKAEVIAITAKGHRAYHNEVVSAGAGACVNLWRVCQELLPILTSLLDENGSESDQPGKRETSVAAQKEPDPLIRS